MLLLKEFSDLFEALEDGDVELEEIVQESNFLSDHFRISAPAQPGGTQEVEADLTSETLVIQKDSGSQVESSEAAGAKTPRSETGVGAVAPSFQAELYRYKRSRDGGWSSKLITKVHDATPEISSDPIEEELAPLASTFEVTTMYALAKESEDLMPTMTSKTFKAFQSLGSFMSINSPLIINILRNLVTYYPMVSFALAPLTIAEPFCLLLHYQEELQDVCDKKQAALKSEDIPAEEKYKIEQEINGRVMIDTELRYSSTGDLDDDGISRPKLGYDDDRARIDSYMISEGPTDLRSRFESRKSPEQKSSHPDDNIDSTQPKNITDKQFMICYPTVWGFVTKLRQWELLNVEEISPLNPQSELINDLVLDDDAKNMIKALAHSYTTQRESKQQSALRWSADFVRNKGDEADVYLESRRAQDLQRNSLVSIFLRALEYYQGILFLTSNRVGAFDDAFVSRIHVIIYYPPFGPKERTKIWNTFFRKLERERIDIRIHPSVYDYVETDKVLKELNWNGREIRNAFNTSIALADYENEKVEVRGTTIVNFHRRHLEQVDSIAAIGAMSRPDAAGGGGSGSSGAQPKQLSSRLMTMKTPASEPPSKRRRVESTNSPASTPGRLSDSELGPVTTADRSARTIYARQGEETDFQKKTDRKTGDGGGDDDTNNDDDLSSASGSVPDSEDDDKYTPAAKAGPGGQRPFSARGRGRGGSSGNGGGYSTRNHNHNRNGSYGGSASWGPLTKLPNSKERRRQNRTTVQQRKQARKTL
ncbi:hypothetical protein DV737_g1317, partial [Chaetothyriales sp. CBS 132003]